MKTAKRILLALFLVAFAADVSLTTAQTPAGVVYYVSNAGDDAANGLTPETAWRTLAHVGDQTFQPGDSVLFRRGDVWRETLDVTSSGTSAGWITFGAYGTGPKPRILGSEPATGWTQVATNVWQSSTSLSNPYQGGYSYAEVFFELPDGPTRWGEHQDYDAAFSRMANEYDWSWNANTLYVYAPSDPAMRYAAVEVPQRDACIRLPSVDGHYVLDEDYVEYVAFDNLELLYAMRHGLYPGYNEIKAHGLRVTNCHVGFIGVKGGSSAYCIAAWHSDMLIQNNTIHDCGRRGISLNTYTTYTPDLHIRNVVIDHNHFYNGFHTTGPDISTMDNRGHTFTNFTISNNLVDDSGRWGAGINDGCYTSSCTSNSIYISTGVGNHYSDFYIYNNVIVGSTSRALLLVGMDNVRVYHNTVYASHPGARPYALITFNDVPDIDFRNNIVYGTLSYAGGANDARCVMDQGAAASFSARDRNLYFQDDLDQPLTGSQYGVGGWDVFISEWDSWRAESGFETHSPYPQLPLWVDSGNGDFRLRPGSPAVDAGVPIPGINDGYSGAAPDLGAFEWLPSLTLHGAPANHAIHLTWSVNTTLPTDATWRIDYYTTTANILTAADPFSATRAYTLAGLANYELYTVTLSATEGSAVLISDTITAMPTDIAVYLPLVLRGG
ncbi:MAG: right-handed parallel beta-helix repeat-containing protein [Anaerolineae bacterium]|nr:right-handed parallel beta-helix repeat-containing protein [Anaerolineae bacterium]